MIKSSCFTDRSMISLNSFTTCRLCVEEVNERQLANTSTSTGTLRSEVVGGADGEGFTTHPPPPFCLSLTAPQIYELFCSRVLHMYACVVALSLRGGRVHTSRFVLCYDPNTLNVALPSLIRGPRSISAMQAQEGRSVLIFL